jgi:hypothetical protein
MRLVLIFLAACAHAAPADHEAVLRRQTQELLDAIAVGDKPVWDRHLDPRVTYVSEAGDIETRASLLAQLDPLPAGVTGRLVVTKLTVQRFGDTAIVVHTDDESVDYFDHPLSARYLTLAVWRLTGGAWRLIGTQVHAVLVDPPAIALPDLVQYTGTYRLTPEITYTVRKDGDHLVGERTGRPAVTLAAEACDVFFVPGQPRSRKVFLRDARDAITGFADRRDGHDVIWRRDQLRP